MEKRIILPSGDDVYSRELRGLVESLDKGTAVLREDELSTDYLLDNNVDVIVSTRRPDRWYDRLRQLNVVTLGVGSFADLHKRCDIVVDCAESVNNKYFTGPDYSLLGGTFDLLEVAN